MEKFIDLHVHSLSSDGNLSVNEIIKMVSRTHSAIAITDHNMFSLPAPIKKGELSVLAGCEFDCAYISPDQVHHNIHMIGLFFKDVPTEVERQLLKDHTEELREYVKAVISKMRGLGFNLSFEEVFGDDVSKIKMGRLTIARYMVEHKMLNDLKEAFYNYIGTESKYGINVLDYVSYPSLEECEKVICAHGGVSILCHPLSRRYRLDDVELENMIKDFAIWAGDGGAAAIEVYYSKYNQKQRKKLLNLAHKYGLLQSAGSDFHSSSTAFIDGNLDLLNKMKRRIAEFELKEGS